MPTPPITDSALYRLTQWLSPAFPVGGYAYSHGIEFAIEDGRIADATTLGAWVEGVLRHGAGRADAALLRGAWEGVAGDDPARFDWAVEWGSALRATAETALESAAQGRAFIDGLAAAWPGVGLDRWTARITEADAAPAHAVVVGMAAAAAGVPLRAALVVYLGAVAGNLVSAGVRLVPLGQNAAQRILAGLERPIIEATDDALGRAPDDAASAAPLIDWTSMKHETQYTRLFRS